MISVRHCHFFLSALQLDAFLKFVGDKEAEQAQKQDHEEPAFVINDIAVQFDKASLAHTLPLDESRLPSLTNPA